MATKGLQSIYNQIRSRILMTGPITVAEYMKLALTQTPMCTNMFNKQEKADSGYYMKKDVFGQHGDFITSPEINQMFGEMIAVWGLQTWLRIGGPKKVNIVELGPGRGTLAKDVLRVFKQFKHLTGDDISLHLVEISPFLARVQHRTLCQSDPFSTLDVTTDRLNGNDCIHQSRQLNENHLKSSQSDAFYSTAIASESGYPVFWYNDIQDVPKEFNFYIAHEFFDALPVHKLQKFGDGWREILVDIKDLNKGEKDNQFRYVVSRSETSTIKIIRSKYEHILQDVRNHIEVSVEGFLILEEIATRLETNGGLSLLVDYGHLGTKEDTFRGFLKHGLHEPLIDPGTADLTADVDFSFIKRNLCDKLMICGPITQATFLDRMGMNARLQILLSKCGTDDEKRTLLSSYKMLTQDMGSRFLCMSLLPKVLEEYLPRLKIACFHDDEVAT